MNANKVARPFHQNFFSVYPSKSFRIFQNANCILSGGIYFSENALAYLSFNKVQTFTKDVVMKKIGVETASICSMPVSLNYKKLSVISTETENC